MKKAIITIAVLLLVAVIAVFFITNRPTRKVDDEQGIAINARSLFQAFSANEAGANQTYLNKAIAVNGVISVADTNQEGIPFVVLQTDDMMSGVMCTMREKQFPGKVGDSVNLKGFCSGFVGDVKLTDCIQSK